MAVALYKALHAFTGVFVGRTMKPRRKLSLTHEGFVLHEAVELVLPFAFLAFAVSFTLRLAEPGQGGLVILKRVRTTALNPVAIDPVRACTLRASFCYPRRFR